MGASTACDGVGVALRPFAERQPWTESVKWWCSALRFLRPGAATRPLHIVTGADASHFRSLHNLLASIQTWEPEATVTIWDLGLTPKEVAAARDRFPSYGVTTFPYGDYPEYFDIRTQRGQYAWKPVIIEKEFLMAPKGVVLVWLDAGDIVERRLKWLRRFTTRIGFFSPYSSGRIRRWTHQGSLDYLAVDTKWLGARNLSAAIVALDTTSPAAKELTEEWSRCAQIRECIAPEGSDRTNHRQDQAVLAVLAYKAGMAPAGEFRRVTHGLGIGTHRDVERTSRAGGGR